MTNVGSWGTDRASADRGRRRSRCCATCCADCCGRVRHLAHVPAPGSRRVPVSRPPRRVRARARSRASAASRRCSTCSSRSTTRSSSTVACSSTRSPVALATRALDTLACWSVRTVVVDTPEHADFFAALHAPRPVALRGAVGRRRGGAVRAGRRPRRRRADPLVPHLHPAARLRDGRARGRAARRRRPRRSASSATASNGPAAEQLARELGLTNIEFVAPMPESELPGRDRARVDLPRRVRHQRQGRARRAEQGVPVRRGRPGRRHRGHAGGQQRVRRRARDGARRRRGRARRRVRELRGPARLAVADRARARCSSSAYSEAALADDLGGS